MDFLWTVAFIITRWQLVAVRLFYLVQRQGSRKERRDVNHFFFFRHRCSFFRFPSLFLFFFPGNIWLCLLVERVPREVPDSNKLPPPSPALPPHWRAAQPSHTERGGTQPLWGPFCSGPHGRLNGWHTSSVWNSSSSSALQLLFLFFLLLLLNGHYAQGMIEIRPEPGKQNISTLHRVLVWLCLQGFPIAWKVLNFIK